MLTKTFCHIKGISLYLEKILWDAGITHWDDFLARVDTNTLDCLPQAMLEKIRDELLISKDALQRNHFMYFKDALNPKEHWRVCPHGKIGFVDIETTGLSRTSSDITIIGIYDGALSHMYVKGQNLALAHEKLQEFDIVVTFNGKQFDVPFLEHHFACTYHFVHLDLRYMLRELDLKGGLKSIECQLGITRDSDVLGIDGFEAVRLWRRYERGDHQALQKLLKYNELDVVNLKILLDYYLTKKSQLLGF